eukprot:1350856-Prymnesium_polylepis.2
MAGAAKLWHGVFMEWPPWMLAAHKTHHVVHSWIVCRQPTSWVVRSCRLLWHMRRCAQDVPMCARDVCLAAVALEIKHVG